MLHVGVGGRGRHWLEYVGARTDFESVGMVDPEPASLEAARAVADVPGFDSIPAAVATVQADAALIASPSLLHAQHALAALDGGLAVMIEKPFATVVAEAQSVLERARALGKTVFVAENFRYVQAERTIRELVRGGFVGKVYNATLVDRRRMPRDTQPAWMGSLRYPQLQELAVHHFDSLRSFFGDPLGISARAFAPDGGYEHDSTTQALIEMEGGVPVQYLGSLASHKFAWRLAIEGENGLLWSDRKRVWWRGRGGRFFRPLKKIAVPKGDLAPYPREGTTSLLNSFRDDLVDGVPAETRGEDNLRTIALMEAGKISDREARLVRIDELLPT